MKTYTQIELEMILESHAEWLFSAGAQGKRANFFKANLQGANFSGTNLVETNLSGANLLRVNLSRANLSGTNLTNVTGLVIPEAGKIYKLIEGGGYFCIKNSHRWKLFENNETGLILGIHGTQNENHLEFEEQKGFDLLILSGNRKGEIWEGIEWWVLLTNIGEEVK